MAQDPPDLILLDGMMAGMDGYELTATLKVNVATRNIPIILVTALNDQAARVRGLSAGAEDSLSKPVDRVELCARVHWICAQGRVDRALRQQLGGAWRHDRQLRWRRHAVGHVAHV